MFVYLSILLAVATIQILIEYFILFYFCLFAENVQFLFPVVFLNTFFFLFLFMFRESDSVERTIVGYLIHHLGIEIAYVF